MQSLQEKVLYSVKKRRNKYDSCRRSGNYLDSNRVVSNCYEGSRKNGKKCSILASTCNLVHNIYRLVSIPSTLCSSCISMKEYNVEGQDSRKGIRKGLSRYIPKECNDILIGYLRGNVYVGITNSSYGGINIRISK